MKELKISDFSGGVDENYHFNQLMKESRKEYKVIAIAVLLILVAIVGLVWLILAIF